MSSLQTPIVTPLPCFLDNYIWHIATVEGDWVVDPGDASVVIAHQTERQRPLAGVLVTHHHLDHTAGLAELSSQYGMPIYGPTEVRQHISHYVSGNSSMALEGLGTIEILAVGAHTLGHIAFYLAEFGMLFCGDSLFSAGCGRLFEGNAADLAAVMARYRQLPPTTKVYPTHEYTEANLRFAQTVEPHNKAITAYAHVVADWRSQDRPSLPTTLEREQEVNPFLRHHESSVIQAASDYAGKPATAGEQTLAILRAWKDDF